MKSPHMARILEWLQHYLIFFENSLRFENSFRFVNLFKTKAHKNSPATGVKREPTMPIFLPESRKQEGTVAVASPEIFYFGENFR